MPIRKELRHLYRGAAWRATRKRILDRAKNCCEQCGVENHARVQRAQGWWLAATKPCLKCNLRQAGYGQQICECQGHWITPHGTVGPDAQHFPILIRRWVGIVLTVAHLNHVAGDDRDENLKALCQWCHLNYDKLHHAYTRATRKDRTRPLLEMAS